MQRLLVKQPTPVMVSAEPFVKLRINYAHRASEVYRTTQLLKQLRILAPTLPVFITITDCHLLTNWDIFHRDITLMPNVLEWDIYFDGVRILGMIHIAHLIPLKF